MASKLPDNINCVPALNTLEIFLNFVHYIFLSPFTVRYDGYLQKFETKMSGTWRKILSALITLASIGLTVLIMISKEQFVFPSWNRALLGGSITAFKLSVIYMLWFQDEKISKLMTAINVFYCKRVVSPENNITKRSKIWPYGVISTLILWLLLDWLRMMSFKNEKFINFFVDRANFLLTGYKNYSQNLEGDFTYVDYTMGATFFVLTCFERTTYLVGSILAILVTIALCSIIFGYVNLVKVKKQGDEFNVIEVLTAMEELHALIDKCSECFGFLYCQLCIFLIPLYATRLNYLFRANFIQAVSILFNMVSVLLVVFPAASANSKIKNIIPWLRSISLEEYRVKNTNENYGFGGSILVQEIQHDGFALRGIFFAITYGFIGNVFGLMITYAMIILQLREK